MSFPSVDIDRRAFLKGLAGLGAAGLLPAAALAQGTAPARWQNWTGNQQANPANLFYPRDIEAIQALLKASQGTVRPFGGSHSFSALVPSDDTLISLEQLNGLLDYDGERQLARFAAGTRLGMASELAWQQGSSFSNEPDINLQSLAGATATATHGTGLGLPSLSGMVQALTLVTASGEVLDLDEDDGALFDAACTHLGALGLVTDITFKMQPAYRLEEHTWTLGLDEAMAFIEQEKDNFRHIEIFAFPLGNTAIVQTLSETDQPDSEAPRDDDNDLLERISQLAMRAGWLTSNLQRLVTLFVRESRFRGPAHRVFANRRTVRFNEMEYTVPAEEGIPCLRRVCDIIRREKINVFFPIEFRYCAAEKPLLSMFHERPGASLSIHQYYQQDHRPLFEAVEPTLQQFAGRPHWGKMHSMDHRQLSNLYPRFHEFQAIRQQLDPQGRFLNDHLRHVLGA